jgi:hypothetical protein
VTRPILDLWPDVLCSGLDLMKAKMKLKLAEVRQLQEEIDFLAGQIVRFEQGCSHDWIEKRRVEYSPGQVDSAYREEVC